VAILVIALRAVSDQHREVDPLKYSSTIPGVGFSMPIEIVYERLIDHTGDPGSIDTLQFLMTREITHMRFVFSGLRCIRINAPTTLR
jgi:hypothetical protein